MEIQVQGNLTTVLIVLSQIVMTLLLGQPLELLYKKDVLKNFAKSTGKHLSRIRFSFLIKLLALSCELVKSLRTHILRNTSRTLYCFCILLKEEKNTLHSKLERAKLFRYTVMLLCSYKELFYTKYGPGIFDRKKIRCKTRKRHI